MDDSERSYGYSQDIFHGRRGAGGDYGERMVRGNGGPYSYPDRPHREGSYEYGSEVGLNDVEDLSPEEAAMHLSGGGAAGGVRRVGRGRYDYGTAGAAGSSHRPGISKARSAAVVRATELRFRAPAARGACCRTARPARWRRRGRDGCAGSRRTTLAACSAWSTPGMAC